MMVFKNNGCLLLIILFVFQSCIENFNLDIDQESYIVFDGLITNKKEASVIIYTFNSTTQKKQNVVSASVKIVDNYGSTSQLIEVSPGVYKVMDGTTGKVGRSYVLEVQLNNGKTYVSEPEEIESNIGIDSIYWEEGVSEYVSEKGNTIEHAVVNMFVDSNEFGKSEKRYRWRYTDIYEFVTTPELHRIPDPERPFMDIPDPEPCSGFILKPSTQTLVQTSECTCCNCYVSEFSDRAILSNERFTLGAFKKVKIQSFSVDDRFRQKFYVEVEQLSLTERAYKFWKLIYKQNDNNTSVFATTPTEIIGNISSVDDPNEKVLGFFGASGVSSISISILRNQITATVPKNPIYSEDCRFRKNSTNQIPDFW